MRACPGGVKEASIRKNEKEGKKRRRRGEKEEKKKGREKKRGRDGSYAGFVIAPRRPINFDRSIARYNYNIYINLYIIYAYD